MRLHHMLLALAPVVAACDPSSPTSASPSIAEGASATARETVLRLDGECRGRFVLIPIDFLPPPLEDLAAHARVVTRERCRLEDLGQIKAVNRNVTDFTGDPFVGRGTTVFTAANGDELWARERIEIPAPGPNPDFTSSGHLTFTGGTGRFKNASGHASFTGGGNSADGTNFRSLRGRVVLHCRDGDD